MPTVYRSLMGKTVNIIEYVYIPQSPMSPDTIEKIITHLTSPKIMVTFLYRNKVKTSTTVTGSCQAGNFYHISMEHNDIQVV